MLGHRLDEQRAGKREIRRTGTRTGEIKRERASKSKRFLCCKQQQRTRSGGGKGRGRTHEESSA